MENQQVFTLSFMTHEDLFAISINYDPAQSYQPVVDLISIFGSVSSGKASIGIVQECNEEIRNQVVHYVEKYASISPEINRLGRKFRLLADNEKFLTIPKFIDESERFGFEVFLSTASKNSSPEEAKRNYEEIIESYENLFSTILHNYHIHNIRTDRKVYIGNKRKKDRICRFCGGSRSSGATFMKTAHAIPEGVGNKNIIIKDECDECNEYFGDNIEPSFIEYFDCHRVFHGIRGKNGFPEIRYKNGKIFYDGSQIVIMAEKITESEGGGIEVRFEAYSNSFIPEFVYRIFSKIVLSVIDGSQLDKLKDVTRWVRHGERAGKPLPKVASNVTRSADGFAPKITVYVRHSSRRDLPHVVGEFRLGAFIYIFILPFSSDDEVDFSDQSNYQRFWSELSHFHILSNWAFSDFSSNNPVRADKIIRFTPKEDDA